jgi:6-phosphogluconolactonase
VQKRIASFVKRLFYRFMRFHYLVLSAALVVNAWTASNTRMLVFVGTYTGGESKGIYSYELNMPDGSLRPLGLAAETANPSFLALHPKAKYLYAVGEIANYQGKSAGAVTGFTIDTESGKLTKINSESTRGGGPCHLVVDKSGRNVLVANYGGGSVAVLPLKENGALGEAISFIQHTGSSVSKQRQSEPHAHSFNLDAANRFAVAADLGLDKLLVYRFDAEKGKLTANDPPFTKTPVGGGPRHFAFHPDGKRAFVCNEMLSSVTAFSYDPEKGILKETQTISTLPQDWKGNNSTAEIQVHPSGKFVYCSNRGHDSIAVYAFDEKGALKWVENASTRGKTPRNFGINPTGHYLIAANQDSNTLAVFRVDFQTGALQPVGDPIAAPKPVCVKFLPRD